MKAERIAELFPEIYRVTVGTRGPLDGFLAAQEALHAPVERVLDRFAEQFDPRLADERFLRMLVHWVDLDYLLDGRGETSRFPGGSGRLRELVAAAAVFIRGRGTAETLVRLLETATGSTGFSVHDGERPFHVRVVQPPLADDLRLLVRRILEREMPAFVTYDLVGAEEDG
jgi:phage tail-like protein